LKFFVIIPAEMNAQASIAISINTKIAYVVLFLPNLFLKSMI